jgi:uncharacterized protein YqeY
MVVRMLSERIRRQMVEATKAGRALEKGILKLALGEVQTAQARAGRDLDDEGVAAILRKLIKSNQESLAAARDAGQRETLGGEIAVLESLLPRTLDVEAICAALEAVRAAIRAAGGDGPATGIAMKHLKAQGAAVTGSDVAQAVRAIRA